MSSRLRLLFASLFLSAFLVACGGDDTDTDEMEYDAMPETSDATTGETTGESVTLDGDVESIEEIQPGMTRAELIEKFGEPSISAERQLDAMKIETLEWETDDGMATAQLVNGKVTYGRVITAE